MADTLTAVVTTDASSYVSGATITVTVTFSNGTLLQQITGVENLCGLGGAAVLSNVKNLVGQSLPASADTALVFTASVESGQSPDLTQSLNWSFFTTSHHIAATAASVTITPPSLTGGRWPTDSN